MSLWLLFDGCLVDFLFRFLLVNLFLEYVCFIFVRLFLFFFFPLFFLIEPTFLLRLCFNEFFGLLLLFLTVGVIMIGFASVSLFIRSNSVLALCTTLSTGDVNFIVELSTIKFSAGFF